MSFVERDDVLSVFEGLILHLFKKVHSTWISQLLPRMSYKTAMEKYGSDKPDIRFDMLINDLTTFTRDTEFSVFRNAAYVGAICVKGAAGYTRKQLEELYRMGKTAAGRRFRVGMCVARQKVTARWPINLPWINIFDQQTLARWTQQTGATGGDLLLVMSGRKQKPWKHWEACAWKWAAGWD